MGLAAAGGRFGPLAPNPVTFCKNVVLHAQRGCLRARRENCASATRGRGDSNEPRCTSLSLTPTLSPRERELRTPLRRRPYPGENQSVPHPNPLRSEEHTSELQS